MRDITRNKLLDMWRSAPLVIVFLIAGIPVGVNVLSPGSEFYDPTGFGMQHSAMSAVVWGGLYAAAGAALLQKPVQAFHAVRLNIPLAMLLILAALSALWSNYPPRTMMNAIHLTGCFTIAIAAAIRYAKEPWTFVIHAALALGVNQVFHLAAVFLLGPEARGIDERWIGFTTHPNTLGMLSFLTLWACAAVLANNLSRHRALYLMLAGVSLVNLYGTNSMTSVLVATSAVAGVLGLRFLQSRFSWEAGKYIILYCAFCIATVFIFITAYEEIVQGFFHLIGREPDLTGRSYMWEHAWVIILEKPLFGHGFGGVHQISGWIDSFHFLDVHNGYIELFIKGGILSFVLFLLILHRLIMNANSLGKHDFFTVSLLTPVILSILIQNMSETTILEVRNMAWFIMMTCIFIFAIRPLYYRKEQALRAKYSKSQEQKGDLR